jgi:beta-lactamase regulating signal transducer with metallopeptidase domain
MRPGDARKARVLSPFAVPAGSVARLSWQAYAMLAWLTVSAVLFVRVIIFHARLRRAITYAFAAADGSLESRVCELAARLGIRRGVNVVRGSDDLSPAIAGWWLPTLIVPRGLESRLTREQLEWVLLHELAHVRRRDLYMLAIERMVECVAWFNPAVWLAGRWAEHYRECACDELALEHTSCSRADCGEAFFDLLSGAKTSPAFAIGVLSHGRLANRRMVRLLDARPQKAAIRVLATIGTIGCVVTIGLASFHTRPMLAAAQVVKARESDKPTEAAATPSTEDVQIDEKVRRIWEQQNAPMRSGRVHIKVLQLSSLQKDPIQQGHELSERSMAEVEALLDGLDLTDESCFRLIRDRLLEGGLILDHPSYRSLDLVWNETGRRATWGNGETTIVKKVCQFEYDPTERSANIADGRVSYFAPPDWAKLILAVPLRSTILGDYPASRSPPSIDSTSKGQTLVEFKSGPLGFNGIEMTWLLAPDGALLRAKEQYGRGTVVREIGFLEYPGGVHLPRVRVRTYYPMLRNEKDEVIGPLQSLSISIIEHAEFNIDIPDSEFRMAVPANTAVWDRRGELKLRAAEIDTEDVLTLFQQ